MKFYKSIILFGVIILITSCKVNPTIKNPYITYYRGDNSLLYFIKPMSLLNGKDKMSVDFTFTDKKIDSASVTVNFSFFNFKKQKSDSFYINSDSVKHQLLNKEIIFEEVVKGKQIVRYSSKMFQKDLLELLSRAKFKFVINNLQIEKHYQLTTKYSKKFKKTSNEIISILKDKFE